MSATASALTAVTGEIDWTDLFAGAGGSSLGLEAVPGTRVVQALNHWDLAVEAHNANFPHADHDVQRIQDVPPWRFRPTRCLWASPECTHHAYCRGRRNDEEEGRRSRATFSDLIRWTAFHRYDAVVVENVVEARLWCDTPGHGGRCSCGSHFNAWHREMCQLGYDSKTIYFNSQFALPTPQSRDRMYVIFWRKGLQAPDLDFRPASWCPSCATTVRGIQTWKPAARNSLRSRKGLAQWGRYGQQYLYTCPDCHSAVAPAVVGAKTIIDWSLPINRIGDRDKPLADKTRERIRTGVTRLTSQQPQQAGNGRLYGRQGGARVWSIDPLSHGLIVATGGQTGQSRRVRALAEPLGAVTTENHRALVLPNMTHNTGASDDEPLGTVTTGNRHMLIQVNRGGERSPYTLEQPTRTIAGHGELALVSFRNHGDTRPVDTPAATLCASGLHQGLLVYNGNPGFVRDLADAAGTVTARDKQALLVGTAPADDEPVVLTDTDVDECLFRMLQWTELLRAQQMHVHGDGRPYELTAKRRDRRGRMRELSNEQRVRMIGNAVSSPVATLIGYAISEMLADAA